MLAALSFNIAIISSRLPGTAGQLHDQSIHPAGLLRVLRKAKNNDNMLEIPCDLFACAYHSGSGRGMGCGLGCACSDASGCYCLKTEGWAADLFGFEGDGDFDVVGDFDEGDAAVHAVVLAIEDHFAVDVFEAVLRGGQSQGKLLRIRDAADREIAVHFENVWSSLNDLRGVEGDRGIVLYVEKFFALQFAVLHAATGVN